MLKLLGNDERDLEVIVTALNALDETGVVIVDKKHEDLFWASSFSAVTDQTSVEQIANLTEKVFDLMGRFEIVIVYTIFPQNSFVVTRLLNLVSERIDEMNLKSRVTVIITCIPISREIYGSSRPEIFHHPETDKHGDTL